VRITNDTEKCIASGACVLACPEVFDQDDDGIVTLIEPSPADALYEKVVEAAGACPASVIQVQP
jgi:ferredoxin